MVTYICIDVLLQNGMGLCFSHPTLNFCKAKESGLLENLIFVSIALSKPKTEMIICFEHPDFLFLGWGGFYLMLVVALPDCH